jgi:hypothetical protein
LAREVPRLRAKSLMRAAFDFAPPNILVNLALAATPVRRIAERVYFHTRNDAGVDRETYLKWLDAQEAGSAKMPPLEV